MKKYKIRLVGLGIEATAIVPFENEPTVTDIENKTEYLNHNLMKIEDDGNFYDPNRYTLTYEELEI